MPLPSSIVRTPLSAVNGDRQDTVAHCFNRICCNLIIYGAFCPVYRGVIQHRILTKRRHCIWVNNNQEAPVPKDQVTSIMTATVRGFWMMRGGL